MIKTCISALLMMFMACGHIAHAQQSMEDVLAQMNESEADGKTSLQVEEASVEEASGMSEAEMTVLLLDKGVALFYEGNYQDAISIFDSILSFDRRNTEALDYKRRAYEQLAARGEAVIPVLHEEAMAEVKTAWNAERTHVAPASALAASMATDADQEAVQEIVSRLKATIIPVFDVAEATAEEVVQFFAETSRSQSAPGADIDFLLVGMEFAEAENNITISVDEMSLYEALQYVVEMASLKFEIIRDLVIIMPANYIPHSRLVMRSYDIIPEVGADMTSAVDANGGGDDLFGASSGGADAGPVDVSGFFSLVDFPDGASAVFQPRFNKLFVKNTPKNLKVIEAVLADVAEEAIQRRSQQVEIETKFVEFTDGALEELGFDWTVYGNGAVAGLEMKDGIYYQKAAGFTDTTEIADETLTIGDKNIVDYEPPLLYNNPVTGQKQITDSNGRRGQNLFGASQRDNTGAFDIINSGMGATLQSAPGAMIIQNGYVDVRIAALERQGTADVLSAPRVVAKSGTEAVIRVSETHRYPQDYDITTGQRTSPVVRPQDWQDFDMGVSLRVTPVVDIENQVIELDLVPEIMRFKGYEDYLVGYNAYDAGGNNTISASGDGSPFLARMPFFQRRVVQTQVTIADGSTIVMGGLVDEKTEKFRDQVPILGDIPYVGRLFRTEGSRSVKKNLTIFVKATQIDANGMTRTDRELASY